MYLVVFPPASPSLLPLLTKLPWSSPPEKKFPFKQTAVRFSHIISLPSHSSCTQNQTQPTQHAEHSIYEYAKFNNVNLPACCFQGSCSSCVSKILKGKVDQHNQCCLNAALTKEGFVALCCAVPLSDVTILTHQGGPMRKLKREMADASK